MPRDADAGLGGRSADLRAGGAAGSKEVDALEYLSEQRIR